MHLHQFSKADLTKSDRQVPSAKEIVSSVLEAGYLRPRRQKYGFSPYLTDATFTICLSRFLLMQTPFSLY